MTSMASIAQTKRRAKKAARDGRAKTLVAAALEPAPLRPVSHNDESDGADLRASIADAEDSGEAVDWITIKIPVYRGMEKLIGYEAQRTGGRAASVSLTADQRETLIRVKHGGIIGHTYRPTGRQEGHIPPVIKYLLDEIRAAM